MRFTKLRLLGFKSFVEPMEFVIENGLTGVVGPNGCGKSNLVEALRWVMGENSYKNMRASGMDDVIFSGSGARPARNSAEVTLFLDNSDRQAPASYNQADELQVSRRIEREAGSVYRINGKEARAKDVQLLFADQSTGARSPSMVGQGRIGELIQAKPQARRALLEEAAGISGLHSRRHEAELRLRAAESNLERLEDVVGELGSQIESLKRQARQANRFKALSADIRRSEAILLHLRWSQAKIQEGDSQSALASATSNVGAMAQTQMIAAKEQAIAAQHLPDLRGQEAAAAAALQRLSIASSQLNEEAARLSQRRSELLKRLEQLSADILREEQMLNDHAGVLQRLDEEEQELLDRNDASGDQAHEAAELLHDVQERLKLREADLQQVTSARAEANAERTQIERLVRESADRRQRLSQQLAVVEADSTALESQIKALDGREAKASAVELLEEQVLAAEEQALAAEELVEQARTNENNYRQPLAQARETLNRIETEARTLATILTSGQSEQFSAVVEQMQVKKGWETALGAALGDDLDAPIDNQAPVFWADLSQGYAGDAPSQDLPSLPQNIVSLASVVDAPMPLYARLSQIGLVDDHNGSQWQNHLQTGQRLVSREGSLWRWDGFTARADAPTPAAQRLAQKNRLAELETSAVTARVALTEAENLVQRAEKDLRDAVERERQSRDHWRKIQRDLALAREALSETERAAAQLTSKQAALDEAKTRLSDSLDEAAIQHEEAQIRLEDMPDLHELNLQLTSMTTQVMADRHAVNEARAAHDNLRHEADNRMRRLEQITGERSSWQMRSDNARRQIEALSDRRNEASDEAETLAEAPADIEERRRELQVALTAAEESRKLTSDRLVQAETEQTKLDKKAVLAIQELAGSRELRARAEERLAAAEERRKDAEARILDVLNCAPHEAIRMTGLGNDDAMPDMDHTDRQLDRLKIERERLGAVNLRAEEEQRELSDRQDAIVKEREDIIEAIKKLRQAIQSLNKEGRERLLAAFDVVNEQFQRLFTHLFGGGTAELQLIESDDPLDAGLEILARPPGKKPQTMTLLSGGEQALTAMALIFAVFLTNPAPICVLDEVDAPLDDHNVERYCNLMDEMAASTQTRFIIITHNPITMARMNRLFGVTMAEQGVSQLVSVDLQTAASFIEPV